MDLFSRKELFILQKSVNAYCQNLTSEICEQEMKLYHFDASSREWQSLNDRISEISDIRTAAEVLEEKIQRILLKD